MKIIGVTGSSGSGKSTVCKILEEKYGAKIIDADKIAKKLSKKGTMYMKSIVEYFGPDIVTKSGALNRKKLADIIYEDDEKREKLNKFTFIYVVDEIKNNINQLTKNELIVIDAPLLFESDLDKVCDFVIGVVAKEEKKIQRICQRDNISEEDALKRLAVQCKDEYLEENADYIIENNSNVSKIEKELEKMGKKEKMLK